MIYSANTLALWKSGANSFQYKFVIHCDPRTEVKEMLKLHRIRDKSCKKQKSQEMINMPDTGQLHDLSK